MNKLLCAAGQQATCKYILVSYQNYVRILRFILRQFYTLHYLFLYILTNVLFTRPSVMSQSP